MAKKKLCSTLIVGTYNNVPFDTVNPPKSKMIVGDVKGKAYDKRIETLKNWCDYKSPLVQHEIHNEFLTGYQFTGETYWENSSTITFCVKDPRGFVFNVRADNLLEIIKNCEISEDTINTPLTYVQDGVNFYLVGEKCPAYIEASSRFDLAQKSNIKSKDLEPYSTYLNKENQTVTFVGTFEVTVEPIVDKSHYNCWALRKFITEAGKIESLTKKFYVFYNTKCQNVYACPFIVSNKTNCVEKLESFNLEDKDKKVIDEFRQNKNEQAKHLFYDLGNTWMDGLQKPIKENSKEIGIFNKYIKVEK